MAYQDKWLNGIVAEKGYRECEKRYEIVRDFCRRFDGPFTVADIGANWCYFGLRLTADFPDCSVVAFEFNSFEARLAHLRKCKAERIVLLNHKLHLADFRILARCCRFDVVLALSVLHHLDGSFDDRLAAVLALGDHAIVEFATEDSHRVRKQRDYQIPRFGQPLGFGESHQDATIRRPIMYFPGIK